MFRKILIFFSLLLVVQVNAQPNDVMKPKKNDNPKIDYTQIGAPMPPLVVWTVDSIMKDIKTEGSGWYRMWHKKHHEIQTNILTGNDLNNGANLFVMMFNPTCSHCIEETELIKNNMHMFKESKLLMMANRQVKPYLGDFVKQRKTKDFPKIIVAIDTSGFLNETFLYRSLPQINVYSGGERKLLKTFMGNIPIDSLKQFIQ